MKRETLLTHKFVDSAPDVLEDGVIYVSIEYTTAIHKCCCGCGKEVVTPITPTDWKLIFDGKTVSLHPSIGSWTLPCRSHYWIRNNRVQWAGNWSDSTVKAQRVLDAERKSDYFNVQTHISPISPMTDGGSQASKSKATWRQTLKGLFRRK